ncbi:predicted protein [Nematostella vectensis]|uniref:Adenylosuccinate synthetase n=1 Tax=Nematostella vectensis TaxID=45351 RepID=A7T255_NEMVE|nr:predicted protein [Nematostella vectensis]|eukprot:XP_001622059.1 predicted protein [Nematostella vectensis]
MFAVANGPTSSPRAAIGPKTKVTVVLGAQWGDEGKGKLVDILATNADVVCRCQGGNNAGHTVVVGDKHYALHMLPSLSGRDKQPANFCPGRNGVVIHIPQFFEELEKLEAKGIPEWKDRLIISERAHLVFDLHQEADKLKESGKTSLGTTKKGIGPAYASKVLRWLCLLYTAMSEASLMEHHFLYQNLFATPCPPILSVVLTIFFPLQELGNQMQEIGREFGVTTGRRRRCGWLDLVMIKYSHMINGFTALAIAKLDVLDTFEEVKLGVAYRYKGELLSSYPASLEVLSKVEVEYLTLPGWKMSITNCRSFDDLPQNAQVFVKKVEEIVQIPVNWVGVGQARDQMINVY